MMLDVLVARLITMLNIAHTLAAARQKMLSVAQFSELH
jgi:hypothetical protein